MNIEDIVDRIEKLEKMFETEREKREKSDKLLVEIKTDYKNILKQLEEISEQIDALRQNPAKRWESAIHAIISAICGGAAGYILNVLTKGN